MGVRCDQAGRLEKENWKGMKERFTEIFKRRTRGEWEEVFGGTDACVTPVLGFEELREAGEENRSVVDMVETPLRVGEGGGWEPEVMIAGRDSEEVVKEWLGYRSEETGLLKGLLG